MSVPIVVLFGRPGSGKGTLAQELVARYGFVQCSTGQAMRQWADGPRPEQQALKAALARGEYGSDQLAARIVSEFIAAMPHHTAGVILDGFPRNPVQLSALIESGLLHNRTVMAIELSTSEAVCRARLAKRSFCPSDGWTRVGKGVCAKCGLPTIHRPEDSDAKALDRRFTDYEEMMPPTLVAWRRTTLPLHIIHNGPDAHPLSLWARWIAAHLADVAAA